MTLDLTHTSVCQCCLCLCSCVLSLHCCLPPPPPVQIKGTYLVVYGPVKTLLIVLVLVLMGAVSSYLFELHCILWPLQGLMLGVGWGREREGRGGVKCVE